MNWYILKVQSNREDSIREGLQRRVKIAGLDYFFGDVIVPIEMVTEFKAGKKRVVKRKLYPGYLVVQMEINEETWFLVRETPGIGDFTGAAGHPTPMLPHEVARIVARQEEKSEEAPKLKISFKRGRPREDQRRDLRELRGRGGQHRPDQRPGDGDDQYLRAEHARRTGILADRGIVRRLWQSNLSGEVKFQVPGGQATPAPRWGRRWDGSGSISDSSCSSSTSGPRMPGDSDSGGGAGVQRPHVSSSSPKVPAAAALLKHAAGIAKGSGVPNKEKVGKVTRTQVEQIVKQKLADLNASDVEHARRMIEGTARSMGLEIVDA